MKAVWNGAVIAESSDTVEVEGNHYFRLADVDRGYLEESAHTSVCPWKGTASYYSIKVGEMTNENAAWWYPEPKPAAESIRDRIAFWRGVEVTE